MQKKTIMLVYWRATPLLGWTHPPKQTAQGRERTRIWGSSATDHVNHSESHGSKWGSPWRSQKYHIEKWDAEYLKLFSLVNKHRPWKSQFLSGNQSSNPYLAGSMLIYWRVTYIILKMTEPRITLKRFASLIFSEDTTCRGPHQILDRRRVLCDFIRGLAVKKNIFLKGTTKPWRTSDRWWLVDGCLIVKDG